MPEVAEMAEIEKPELEVVETPEVVDTNEVMETPEAMETPEVTMISDDDADSPIEPVVVDIEPAEVPVIEPAEVPVIEPAEVHEESAAPPPTTPPTLPSKPVILPEIVMQKAAAFGARKDGDWVSLTTIPCNSSVTNRRWGKSVAWVCLAELEFSWNGLFTWFIRGCSLMYGWFSTKQKND